MRINWTFGRTLAAGFAIAVLTLLVVGTFGYRSTERLIENDRLVSHTNEVREQLANLLSVVKDAETEQRGFVITGQELFLAPYQDAVADIEKRVADARRLTADNDVQQRRLAVLQPLIESRLAQLSRIIEVRRAEGLDAAAKLVMAGESKAVMDKVRLAVGEMDEDEARLLKLRAETAEQSAENAKSVILW